MINNSVRFDHMTDLSHHESTIHTVNVIGTCMSLFQERYMDGKQASGLLYFD